MWRPRVFNVFKHSKSVQVEKKIRFHSVDKLKFLPWKREVDEIEKGNAVGVSL